MNIFISYTTKNRSQVDKAARNNWGQTTVLLCYIFG